MGYDNQKSVWVIGYGRVMGYQYEIPANRLGKLKNLCVIKEYGLYGVWVISESTVLHGARNTVHTRNMKGREHANKGPRPRWTPRHPSIERHRLRSRRPASSTPSFITPSTCARSTRGTEVNALRDGPSRLGALRLRRSYDQRERRPFGMLDVAPDDETVPSSDNIRRISTPSCTNEHGQGWGVRRDVETRGPCYTDQQRARAAQGTLGGGTPPDA
jgi:hypothetical protein